MNSKQINFFIVPDDWEDINQFFREMGASFIIQPILKKDDVFMNAWNHDIIARQIFLTNQGSGYGMKLKAINKRYYLDISRSCALEFTRGGFYPNADNELHRARFYATFKYYDDAGTQIEKDPTFIKWVSDTMKLFKKRFLKKTDFDKQFLFSENAIKWMTSNNARVDAAGLKAYPLPEYQE